ncbi:MAG: TolC family protein [Cytophagaceae bacterium]|nr:TolC family protein [Cytophagaceae bacterium]
MKRKIFGFIFCISVFYNTQAQTDSAMTLQQCIDYALTNQVSVVNAQLDESIAKGKVNQVKALGTPQINGAVSLIDNPELSRMFFSPTNPFAAGGTGGPFNIKQSGDIYVADNLFQLRSAGDASITIGQLIFDGSYFVGLQAASTYKELAQKTTTQTKIQTVENVTKAYYMVVINQERTNLFDINLKRLDSLLREIKILNQNGFVEKIDVFRTEVQYNNLVTEKQKFDNMLELSRLLLKFQMGMPLNQPISITEKIENIQFDPNALNSTGFDYTKRIEYSLLQTGEQLQMLDLKNLRYQRLPKLSAFAKGGMSRSDVRFGNLFKNNWYTYSMVGLNLSVPILGLQSQYAAKQSKFKLQQVQNNMKSLEIGLGMQAKQAELNYKNSIQAMETQKRNMELAQEVSRVSKIKYAEGVGSNLEVTNAEADLKQAQINYYEALYNALVAKIDFQKSQGTLYNGQ